MNEEELKLGVIYSRPGKLYGNDVFDLRAGTIKSVNYAKRLVNEFQFDQERIAAGRNLVLPFWGSQKPIYLDWRIPVERKLVGTEIYKTDSVMSIEFALHHFIHLAAQRKDLLAMVPMDISAKSELDRYAIQARAFDLKNLINGIGILN